MEKIIKLFISQPMRDKTNEEILAERKKAIELCRKKYAGQQVEIIDSFFKDAPHDAKPLWFLGKSFELLSTADAVYFAPGWNKYRGCIMEHEAAIRYDKEIIDDQDNGFWDFWSAVQAMKDGAHFRRAAWPENTFITYQKGYPDGIPCNKQTAEAWGIAEGSKFVCNPYLQIQNADGSHGMYAPSCDDILTKDWCLHLTDEEKVINGISLIEE